MVKSSPGVNPKPRFGPILDSTVNFVKAICRHALNAVRIVVTYPSY